MCFVAGTKVHTPGGLKNIEDIRIGESVLAKNEVTGEVDYRKVLLTPVTKTKSIVDVITEKETISATPNHRFWVENKGWADAESLRSGDQFITSYSTKVTIKSIVLREAPQTVYNLTVDEFHTYFVGEEGVWVHNQYGRGPFDLMASEWVDGSMAKAIDHWDRHSTSLYNRPMLMQDYILEARNFLDSPPQGAWVGKRYETGATIVLDPKTYFFGVKNSAGKIQTLYKLAASRQNPQSAYNYFIDNLNRTQ